MTNYLPRLFLPLFKEPDPEVSPTVPEKAGKGKGKGKGKVKAAVKEPGGSKEPPLPPPPPPTSKSKGAAGPSNSSGIVGTWSLDGKFQCLTGGGCAITPLPYTVCGGCDRVLLRCFRFR